MQAQRISVSALESDRPIIPPYNIMQMGFMLREGQTITVRDEKSGDTFVLRNLGELGE